MTILAVTDTETTGAEPHDRVCEMGIVLLRARPKSKFVEPHGSGRNGWRWSSLINPLCPVSPAARAAHHITDEMLADKWTMEKMLEDRGLPEYDSDMAEDEVVLVAHSAEFDVEMLLQSGVPYGLLPKRKICTYRCAKHLWPRAQKHSNQALVYWLGVKPEALRSVPPHRALPDALDTAALVTRMLRERSVDELVELTKQPFLIETCPYGEHSGKPWSQVPPSFLKWVLDKGPRRANPDGGRDIGFDEDTRHTCRHWLDHYSRSLRR